MIVFIFFLTTWMVSRITRLITEDAILDEPRQWLLGKIWDWRKPGDVHTSSWEPPYLRKKIHYLLTCPWCSSLYVSAAALGLLYAGTNYSIPVPWFWWPASAMVAVMHLEYTDGERPVLVRLKK